MTEHNDLSDDEQVLIEKVVADAKHINLGGALKNSEFLEPPPRDGIEWWRTITAHDIHLLLQRNAGKSFTLDALMKANNGTLNISRIAGVPEQLQSLEEQVPDGSVDVFHEVQNDLLDEALQEALDMHGVSVEISKRRKFYVPALAKLREECERN